MSIELPLEWQRIRPVLAGSNYERQTMTQAVGRIRVALAAFDHGADLCPALVSLDQVGFDSAQLGIAARASIFSKLKGQYVAGTLNTACAAGLICGSSSLGLTVADEALRTSAGPFWPTLAFFGSVQGQPPVTAPWMAPQLRDELTRHLANGAILLGVGAGSADQQKSATHILLNHSSHRVQTHDFRH